jgi:hypothetical protein
MRDASYARGLRDGEKVDRAGREASADAIRRHREANVPMAVWEHEQVKLVSPFDVPLPEEVAAEAGKRAHAGD